MASGWQEGPRRRTQGEEAGSVRSIYRRLRLDAPPLTLETQMPGWGADSVGARTDWHHQDGNAPPGVWARVTQREKIEAWRENTAEPRTSSSHCLSLFLKSARRIKCSQQSQ